jgi:hypothetical protein
VTVETAHKACITVIDWSCIALYVAERCFSILDNRVSIDLFVSGTRPVSTVSKNDPSLILLEVDLEIEISSYISLEPWSYEKKIYRDYGENMTRHL